MNCRFCGNFVPEGRDSCPVCGRRPEEEPIGKLLSENQPGAAPSTEITPAAAENEPKGRHPKGLILPLIMIALGVLGWMYALLGDSAEQFKSMLAIVTGTGTSQSANSSFELGAAAGAGELEGVTIYLIFAAAVTVIGIAGVILLFKRLYNRIKYRD